MAVPIASFLDKGVKRDEDGYPILHTSTKCVKCNKEVDTNSFEQIEAKRKYQVLGYCYDCQIKIMGDIYAPVINKTQEELHKVFCKKDITQFELNGLFNRNKENSVSAMCNTN